MFTQMHLDIYSYVSGCKEKVFHKLNDGIKLHSVMKENIFFTAVMLLT